MENAGAEYKCDDCCAVRGKCHSFFAAVGAHLLPGQEWRGMARSCRFTPSVQGPARNIVRHREVQPAVHHRRSIRLPAWNYSESGAYFVTICTHHRECILDDAANLAIVEDVWRRVVGSGHGPGEFVAIPNRVHGIVWIEEPDAVGAEQLPEPRRHVDQPPNPSSSSQATVAQPLRPGLRDGLEPGSLPVIVRTVKSATAKRLNSRRRTRGSAVWQDDYYEHIIRDEDDLNRVRQYILDNPRKWAEDPDNPAVFMNQVGENRPPVGAEQLRRYSATTR
jgi:REP-associated tyrosine transposase